MKSTTKSPNLTSFYDSEVIATVKELIQVLGEPAYDGNDGDDKVNYEWVLETELGNVFTVYDWKHYRSISTDEQVYWHIGGHSSEVTVTAKREIEEALNNRIIESLSTNIS
jgi:hypothetical protein